MNLDNPFAGFPHKRKNQSNYPRRIVPAITAEDDRRVDEKIAAMRTVKQTGTPSKHPALRVLEEAGVEARPGALRVEACQTPRQIREILNGPSIDEPADISGWGSRKDREILREYTEKRLTLGQIAIRHGRGKDFIRKRLLALHAVEYF